MNTETKGQIIKTSRKYWTAHLTGYFILAIFIGYFISAGEIRSRVLAWLALPVMSAGIFVEIKNARSAEIRIEKSHLGLKFQKRIFRESWDNIVAIEFAGLRKRIFMTVYLEKSAFQMPLEYFNADEVKNAIREYALPESLMPFARQKLMSFEPWKNDITQRTSGLVMFVSLYRNERWIAILTTCVGLAIGYILSLSDAFTALCFGGGFAMLGILTLIQSSTSIEASTESIILKTILRQYEFRWKILEKVYVHINTGTIFLIGGKSRLILPGTAHWYGPDKELLSELVSLKLETAKIENTPTPKYLFWLSKIQE